MATYLFTRDLRTYDNPHFSAFKKKHPNGRFIYISNNRTPSEQLGVVAAKELSKLIPLKVLRGTLSIVRELIASGRITELWYVDAPELENISFKCDCKIHQDRRLFYPESPYKVFTLFYEEHVRKMRRHRIYPGNTPLRREALALLKNLGEFSGISMYLNHGIVSVREVCTAFIGRKELVRSLIWREFYYAIHPYQAAKIEAWRPSYKQNAGFIRIWKMGNTGFEFIDSHMRELAETGRISNRGRLACANLFIKVMKQDWRVGEKYFADTLIDYDPVLNLGNWLWVAGIGVSREAPFRIYSPDAQLKKHDPNHEHANKWLPHNHAARTLKNRQVLERFL